MKQFNYQKGKLGEEAAKNYLIKKGYKILESNFSTRFGEIDLIALKNKVLIFVEVKAKEGENFGLPEEMINSHKIFQIKRMAEVYLQQNQDLAAKYPLWRLDAVCLVYNAEGEIDRINHYESLE
ncbi:MAG: YraN family protein [Candidatus Shapirobacteria bacterium]